MRILIADDHEVVRRGVRVLLEANPGWEVVGEAENGRDAVELARKTQPEVAIMDVGMPGLNGFDATRQVCEASPRTAVLILTMHESEQVMREVLAAGASGYVLKSDAGRDLVSAVEALAQHKTFFSSSVADEMLRKLQHAPDDREASALTHREREVVQLLTEGKGNKEVAGVLGISVRTVETHRANIMRKLGCRSLSDLVHYAIRNNLTQP
jgi:DNA-binding NarL/FixJ family response regulator